MDSPVPPPDDAEVPQFEIDESRSQVWVTASSSLHPIKATTTAVRGWIDAEVRDGGLDLAGAARAELEVDVEHLATGNPFYDRELRRRAEVDRYPSITGALTAISAAGEDGQYRVSGDVTFHGVTRSVADDMEVVLIDPQTVALGGSSSFDVRDFGVEPPKLLGLRVHPDVTVRVRLVAVAAG